MFKGSIVALVTPMQANGQVDYECLKSLVNWHCESGTDAIVALGTTGESVTLDETESRKVLETVISETAKRIPVIAGTGTTSTNKSIKLTQQAEALGADGVLVVTPYYNKPTQAGMLAHFTAIADSSQLPVLLYNVPGRTAVDLLPDTVIELASHPRIVGIKEATGDMQRLADIRQSVQHDFLLLSGDDPSFCEFMRLGGHGVISVTANVAPKQMAEIVDLLASGDTESAERLDEKIRPLHETLFVEANPIPAKWLLNKLGRIPQGIRLPLLPLSVAHQKTVIEAANRALDCSLSDS